MTSPCPSFPASLRIHSSAHKHTLCCRWSACQSRWCGRCLVHQDCTPQGLLKSWCGAWRFCTPSLLQGMVIIVGGPQNPPINVAGAPSKLSSLSIYMTASYPAERLTPLFLCNHYNLECAKYCGGGIAAPLLPYNPIPIPCRHPCQCIQCHCWLLFSKYQNPAIVIGWGSNSNITVIIQTRCQLNCTTCRRIIIPTAKLPLQPPVQSTALGWLVPAHNVNKIKSWWRQLAWAIVHWPCSSAEGPRRDPRWVQVCDCARSPLLLCHQCIRVSQHSWAYPQNLKVLKHFIYMLCEIGMILRYN